MAHRIGLFPEQLDALHALFDEHGRGDDIDTTWLCIERRPRFGQAKRVTKTVFFDNVPFARYDLLAGFVDSSCADYVADGGMGEPDDDEDDDEPDDDQATKAPAPRELPLTRRERLRRWWALR
jgi:hypothetical protein